MDNLEKVEKLREKANVSYEEAREALEANGWDLLDAIVSLEKQGRTRSPEQTSYSTSYEEQNDYVSVKQTIKEEEEKKKKNGGLKGLFRKFIRICRDNSFCVLHKDRQIVQIPLIGLIALLFFFWEAMIPVMLIALFFQVRYRFVGKDDLREVNEFMASAENMAEQIKEGFAESAEKNNSGSVEREMSAPTVTEPEAPAAEEDKEIVLELEK